MDTFDQGRFEAEVQERWGETEAYRESSRRTRQYTPEDWKTIKGQAQAIEQGLAEAMKQGEPADGVRAMDLAEQARLHIDRWFYPCGHAMHDGLADMYVSDPRFKANYEDRAQGLAEFVSEAIHANVRRSTE